MELKLPTLNSSKTKWIWFVVLTVQSTILMFDRISFSSILQDISKEICSKDGCDKKALGFITSFYFIVGTISSPIGGSLGDRISRKHLLIIGLCIWSGFIFLMTFMTEYWPFLLVNGMSAVGVLLFANITPTLIADLFEEEQLGWIYGIITSAVPFGAGLGILVPTAINKLTGHWRYSLRITPGITLLNAIIIFFLLSDPPRGYKGKEDEEEKEKEHPASFWSYIEYVTASVWSDIKYLISIKSYVLLVTGFAATNGFNSVIGYWGPSLFKASAEQNSSSPIAPSDVGLYLGMCMILGGAAGLGTSSISDYFQLFNHKYIPLLMSLPVMISLPFMIASCFIATTYIIPSYVLYGIFGFFTFIPIPFLQKAAMGIILPSKRVFGFSLLQMFNLAIGNASSPAIFGVILDYIKTKVLLFIYFNYFTLIFYFAGEDCKGVPAFIHTLFCSLCHWWNLLLPDADLF